MDEKKCDPDTLLCIQDFADELKGQFQETNIQFFGMKVIVVSDDVMKHVKDKHGNPVKWMLVDSRRYKPKLASFNFEFPLLSGMNDVDDPQL